MTSLRPCLFGAAASFAAALFAGTSGAGVVRWDCNAVVPADGMGLLVDVDGQQLGTSAVAVPGWDINPYGPVSPGPGDLQFDVADGAGMLTGIIPGEQTASSLPVGAVVGPAGTFSSNMSAVIFGAGAWQLNAINYFGFRFLGGDGLVHYGYGCMNVGASPAVRTLAYISYESTPGAAITVPGPGALALLGIARRAAGRRRR